MKNILKSLHFNVPNRHFIGARLLAFPRNMAAVEKERLDHVLRMRALHQNRGLAASFPMRAPVDQNSVQSQFLVKIFESQRRFSAEMAVSKKAAVRLEADIEKYRVECNWEKVTELIKNSKTKIPALGQ